MGELLGRVGKLFFFIWLPSFFLWQGVFFRNEGPDDFMSDLVCF